MRLTHLAFRLMLAALLTAPALATVQASAAPKSSPPRLSTPELIERAVGRGEISRAKADLFLAYALGEHRLLPDRYEGDVRWDGTLPLLRLQERLRAAPPSEERAQARSVLAAGDATNCGSESGALANNTSSTHFYVQYGTFGGGLTITNYLTALETSWTTEVDTFGWAEPPIAPTPAPGSLYHVRVDDLGSGLYGFVSRVGTHAGSVGNNPATPWNEGDAYASCMVLNRNYDQINFPSPPLESLQSTAAHEFNHSIQFGYGAISGTDSAFVEGGATWMEDEVFDAADDNHFYLWPTFSESMGAYESSLPSGSQFPYPYWVVFRALTEPFGAGVAGGGEDVMQAFWESISQNGGSTLLNALNDALVTELTTLADAYHDAAIALKFNKACVGGYVLPHCLEEGPDYLSTPGVAPTAVHRTVSSVGGSVTGTVQDNYALNWVRLPLSAEPYTVRLANTSAGGQLRMTVACDTGAALTLVPLASTVVAGANHSIDAFSTTGCTSAIGVITNQAQTSANPASSTARSYQLSTFPERNLTLTTTGDGTLTPSPVGADCGTGCYRYAHGTAVTVTASPNAGSGLASWGGVCASGTDLDCALTMNADKSASATFGLLQSFTIDPIPVDGSVTGPGIACPGDCTEDLAEGRPVTLMADPDPGYGVDTWGGACAAAAGDSCDFTMSGPQTASVAFEVVHSLTVTVDGTGTGSVLSDQPGISCDPNCSREYPEGEVLTLTAIPAAQSEFLGWGGDCASFGTLSQCQLTLDSPKTATATFKAIIYRPDGRIRKASNSSFLGNNLYSLTGITQRVTSRATEGHGRSYFISIDNDGNVVDSFRIRGPGGNAEFKVTYKDAAGNSIGSQVKAGTYVVANLAPGASRVIKVRIKAKLASEPGDKRTARVIATSTHDAGKQDAVKARLRVI